MGFPWKTYVVYMEGHGIPWKYLGNHGILWKLPQVSMKVPWSTMVFTIGFPW